VPSPACAVSSHFAAETHAFATPATAETAAAGTKRHATPDHAPPGCPQRMACLLPPAAGHDRAGEPRAPGLRRTERAASCATRRNIFRCFAPEPRDTIGQGFEDGGCVHATTEDARAPSQSCGAASFYLERRARPITPSVRLADRNLQNLAEGPCSSWWDVRVEHPETRYAGWSAQRCMRLARPYGRCPRISQNGSDR